MKITEVLEKATKESMVKAGIDLVYKNPEKNIDKLFELVNKIIGKKKCNLQIIQSVQENYRNNKNTREFIQNIIKTTDRKSLEKFAVNFLAHAVWIGMEKRDKLLKEKGIKSPFTLFIDTSMRCNFNYEGCDVSSYSKGDDISFKEINKIIKEAKDIGVYYFVILGGEPFLSDYMLEIYKKYNDCIFVPFTNESLIDEKMANKIQKLGNLVPMISLEAFEEETDKRRGKGIFRKVINGMNLLKKRGVLFGVSTAVSRYNVNTVTSEKFIDMLIDNGSKISWYFDHMREEKGGKTDLILTPDQRLKLGKKAREIRNNKPYFVIDFKI